MAPSSDVKTKDEDKNEDESNNLIARSFDESSAENLMTDCNIVNTTTELNYDATRRSSDLSLVQLDDNWTKLRSEERRVGMPSTSRW